MHLLLSLFIAAAAAPPAPAAPAPEKKKVLRLDAIKVEGRIQKPQAFYILQRSNLNFDGLQSQESFLPNIHKAIQEKPF